MYMREYIKCILSESWTSVTDTIYSHCTLHVLNYVWPNLKNCACKTTGGDFLSILYYIKCTAVPMKHESSQKHIYSI